MLAYNQGEYRVGLQSTKIPRETIPLPPLGCSVSNWCPPLPGFDCHVTFGPPGPAFQPRHPLRCIKEQRGSTLWTFLHVHKMMSTYDFGFHHLQLAMERHRLSTHYGLSTDSLSFIEIEESTESDVTQRLTTPLSVDARVSANLKR